MRVNLLDVFNEPDPARRATVIAENYADDVVWHEPDRIIRGRKHLERRAEELRAENPDWGRVVGRSRSGPMVAFLTTTWPRFERHRLSSPRRTLSTADEPPDSVTRTFYAPPCRRAAPVPGILHSDYLAGCGQRLGAHRRGADE